MKIEKKSKMRVGFRVFPKFPKGDMENKHRLYYYIQIYTTIPQNKYIIKTKIQFLLKIKIFNLFSPFFIIKYHKLKI